MSSGIGVNGVDWLFVCFAVGTGAVTLVIVLTRLKRTFNARDFGRRPSHAAPRSPADPLATALLAGSAIVKLALGAVTVLHVRMGWLWYVLLALGLLRFAFKGVIQRRNITANRYGSRAGRTVRRR